MTCSCPKCSFQLDISSIEIPENGYFTACPECKCTFTINRISFAKRAIVKNSDIVCTECGNNPGNQIFCESCHKIYPDFIVVTKTSSSKRSLDKIIAYLTAHKSFKKQGSAGNFQAEAFGSTQSKQTKYAKPSVVGNFAQRIIALLVLLIALSAGAYFYYQNKIETEYSENYVRTIFGIKSARDAIITISSRIAADAKNGSSVSIKPAEQKILESAQKGTISLIGQLGKVPEKFNDNNNALKKLNDSFIKLHSAVTATVATADNYEASIKRADSDFKTAANELKNALPNKIANQLAASKKKYKQLQDF